jgi:hypothetical protein
MGVHFSYAVTFFIRLTSRHRPCSISHTHFIFVKVISFDILRFILQKLFWCSFIGRSIQMAYEIYCVLICFILY